MAYLTFVKVQETFAFLTTAWPFAISYRPSKVILVSSCCFARFRMSEEEQVYCHKCGEKSIYSSLVPAARYTESQQFFTDALAPFEEPLQAVLLGALLQDEMIERQKEFKEKVRELKLKQREEAAAYWRHLQRTRVS